MIIKQVKIYLTAISEYHFLSLFIYSENYTERLGTCQ